MAYCGVSDLVATTFTPEAGKIPKNDSRNSDRRCSHAYGMVSGHTSFVSNRGDGMPTAGTEELS